MPKNPIGYQFAKLGSAYAGITPFDISDPQYKEYIETRLSQDLNPAINYYVEYWVSLADKSAYAIENMGAFFSTDTMTSTSIIMNSIAQIEHIGGILSDTANWVKVSGYFKPPDEGYQFLTIGNFNTNDSTNYQHLGGVSICYYYIENVVVIDSALQHTIGIESSKFKVQSLKLSVFPNPAGSDITLEFSSGLNQHIEIQIFNVMGNMVLSEKRFCQRSVNLDVSKLRSGIYFIRVSDESGRVYSRKLLIDR